MILMHTLATPVWVQGLALVTFISVFTLAAVYAERKVSAYIQDRMGPTETGPFGLLQTLADVIKLVVKEPITPITANRLWFWMAPALVFTAVFAGYAVIPFHAGGAAASVSIGAVWVLAIVAADVIGILMAGWGSMNKFAMLGAVRAVAQIIAYEVPAGLALMAGLVMAGSLDWDVVAASQGVLSEGPSLFLGIWDLGETGGITSWLAFRYPHLLPALLIYFIASLAECNRAPFDLPEAESELVAGFHTEYGGVGFALFFLTEYGKMMLVSLIAVTLFLGGWNTPLPNIGPAALADWTTGTPGAFSGVAWGLLWLLAKALALIGLQMWVRWTYPRLRVDQLMRFCWKVLTPAALGLLLISAVWKIALG